MVAGGAALARDDGGRVVFVDGALPGERVRARLTEERKDFARAVAVEVLEPSPDRVAPPCPALAAGCGGCTWQHVARRGPGPAEGGRSWSTPSAASGGWPTRRRRRSVPLPGPALRTTARLAVTADGRAGHRRRGTTAPARRSATDACLAVHPLLEELIVDGRYPGAGEVLLRVGVASGERLVQVRPRRRPTCGCRPDVAVVAEGDGRPAFVHEEVAGRRFRVSAASFFQPGPVAAEGLVAAVSDAVGESLPARRRPPGRRLRRRGPVRLGPGRAPGAHG